MKLRELVSSFEALAPTKFAESWDNVGLLAGDPEKSVMHVGLTVDLTLGVLEELVERGCDVIYAYHPPIFQALKRLSPALPAIRPQAQGIALYSPHTALDVATGGTNDMLGDILGMEKRAPIVVRQGNEDSVKLVTFVPRESKAGGDVLGTVSRALFEAGAGEIGNYSCCSFRSPGQGSFKGGDGTHPTIGRTGELEAVEETRLEVVVPIARIPEVIAALRSAHPYEEPAFDLVRLAPRPSDFGMGRIGNVAGLTLADALSRLKNGLGVSHVLVAGNGTRFDRVAVAAGSAGDIFRSAKQQGAELFVTGEMRHHDALEASALGLTVVCVLHSNSERKALESVRARLAALHPDCTFSLSAVDRDPFRID